MLTIPSPKRRRDSRQGWADLFPYYAGYPESFAKEVLASANLDRNARIFDPWNGSGSTTSAAASLNLRAIGHDINPVMAVVAKARLLPGSEWTSLRPLSRRVIQHARSISCMSGEDRLGDWFDKDTVRHLRRLERSVFEHLVDVEAVDAVQSLSSVASVFYVALFSTVRTLCAPFRASNPTWMKVAKVERELLRIDRPHIDRLFLDAVERARSSCRDGSLSVRNCDRIQVLLADSSLVRPRKGTIDFILSSPPYCTRLDYTAATRTELAVLSLLFQKDRTSLSAEMLGSVRVPQRYPRIRKEWGRTATSFLDKVRIHPSHASNTYYLKSHSDYFRKLYCSLSQCSVALRPSGRMALVVQDSLYKGERNDLQRVTEEMCAGLGLRLVQRCDFNFQRSMRDVNSRSKGYGATGSVTESGLVFIKDN
jgi:hypothetical protein